MFGAAFFWPARRRLALLRSFRWMPAWSTFPLFLNVTHRSSH